MNYISENTKKIYNQLLDELGQISKVTSDGRDQDSLELFKKDILEYLLCLAITDGRIENEEIAFMWDLIPDIMNDMFGLSKYSQSSQANYIRIHAFRSGALNYCKEQDSKALKLAIIFDEEMYKRSKRDLREYSTVKLLLDFYKSLGEDFLAINSFLDTTVTYTKIVGYVEKRYNQLIHGDSAIAAAGAKKAEEGKTEAPKEEEEPEKTLEELMAELDELVGLTQVKAEINSMVNLIKIRKIREERGLKNSAMSFHMVFSGNPGTGKTTIARLLAAIYKKLGVLSVGNLIEVDRGGLVAGYVGQTAIKTQKVIDSAKGGILFIDEAYALTNKTGGQDFGQEAIETLLKAMEDNRGDFIVIVAGYTDLMGDFIQSNPGLKSRFNKYIDFPDYEPEELMGIFKIRCKSAGYKADEKCTEYSREFFEMRYKTRDENYANARDVRNYVEKAIAKQADRLAQVTEELSDEDLMTLTKADVEGIAI